ncbi:hypothetical protein MKW98_002314 [Papaver atlanticum]|uniref:Uncharacterized protein n=1 Tax=Papaver atlanticum TaxID=357466 RepID=A0AAD4X2Y1_9MAGN|nr:hypothetical protein MKW98_002314 [Papaver atlanticum]
MTLMFLGILLLLISWSFVLGIFRTWWMSRIWSFGSQAPQNRQIAQRRRRNREVLEKQQTLYKSQIANHRVQQPAQLEDPNRLLNTESTLSRRQAAQRIRRNRELAEKAEGEFQRRSLGQTLRQHRELQQANANRGTETTGQVFGVTTPRDNSRKRKGKAIARHQQDKLCSHNSGNRCKRAMGISISSNSNSSHDRTIDEEFYEIGSTDDEVVSDNETESATALSQDTGAHANSCLYPNVRHSLGSMNNKTTQPERTASTAKRVVRRNPQASKIVPEMHSKVQLMQRFHKSRLHTET